MYDRFVLILDRGKRPSRVRAIEKEYGGSPRKTPPYFLPVKFKLTDAKNLVRLFRHAGGRALVVDAPIAEVKAFGGVNKRDRKKKDYALGSGVRGSEGLRYIVERPQTSEPPAFPEPPQLIELNVADAGVIVKKTPQPPPPPVLTTPADAQLDPQLGFTPVDILYATDRALIRGDNSRKRYGADRDELQFGVARVSIPKRHRPGELERPLKLFVLTLPEDPRKHFVVLTVNQVSQDEWSSILKGTPSSQSVLLFVHGFNVSFEEAVRRTAQLAYDLTFEGVPILFSWPSRGELDGYEADVASSRWAVDHLQAVLSLIASVGAVREINAIAHSMGGEALCETISRFADAHVAIRMNQVILAAPDIDAGQFRDHIARRLISMSTRCSLYASSGDVALAVSDAIHHYPRAGQGGENLVLVEGLDTIDASPIDTGLIGHGYFADNKQVIDDLFNVVRNGLPPEQRNLRRRLREKLPYWVFPGPRSSQVTLDST